MINAQQLLGKWKFDYWLEEGKTAILTLKGNGVAFVNNLTRYDWEVFGENSIRIFIDDYVEYTGYIQNGIINGHAHSDYGTQIWTWKARRWTGPSIEPINASKIAQKKWLVINETEELENFKVSFSNDGKTEVNEGEKGKWHIENGDLLFSYANGYITYRAQNVDGIIKGKAKNLACFEWDFILNFLEDIRSSSVNKNSTKPREETLNKFKDDKNQIIQYLQNNDVKCFYHFTDIENIPYIKQYGGLFSWEYILTKGWYVPKQGGDEWSKQLDKKHNLQDYVRLSFCDDHPMAYICKKRRGMNLVLLMIKIDVAALRETRFSDINAATSAQRNGPTFKDLQRVDIPATKRHYVRHEDVDFGPHQAEVMVKRHIPLEYIVNIDNPIPYR